jgi:hypothetical protein
MRHLRRVCTPAVACAAFALACVPAPDSSPPEDAVLESVAEVVLEPDSTRPLQLLAELTLWEGRYVLVDSRGRNVKVYEPDGRLFAVLGGTAGSADAFEEPVSAAALPNGELAVLDAAGRIARFAPSGSFLGVVDVPARMAAVRPGPEGDLLLAGTLHHRADVPAAARDRLVHRYRRTGELVESMLQQLPYPDRMAPSFSSARIATAGRFIAATTFLSDRLMIRDVAAGTDTAFAAGGSDYRRVRWETRPAASDLEAVGRWASRQMWTMRLFALSDDCFLLGFAEQLDAGNVRFAWALVGAGGEPLGRIAGTTEELYHAAHGQAYGVSSNEAGDIVLRVSRVRHPRCGPGD